MSANVYVVVPAYNEGSVVADVVIGLLDEGYSVIVVNDGSTDNTADNALKAGAIVVSHSVNLGQGAALQTGIDLALQKDSQVIVTFDGDGQHSIGDIKTLIGAMDQYGVDVVLGSRFLGKAHNIPLNRRLLLKAACWFTWVTGGPFLTDVHNGIRAFRRDAASSLKLKQAGMAHASEILYKIASSKMLYKEVPVSIQYSQYSRRKGQKSIIGAIRILMDLVALGDEG